MILQKNNAGINGEILKSKSQRGPPGELPSPGHYADTPPCCSVYRV